MKFEFMASDRKYRVQPLAATAAPRYKFGHIMYAAHAIHANVYSNALLGIKNVHTTVKDK